MDDRTRPKLTDRRANGFSLLEVMIAAALFSVVALAASTLTTGLGRAIGVSASQASNISLASALRSQIARRATCGASLAAPPNFTTGGPVAITLGPGTVVRAGTDLAEWKLSVTSLLMRNLTAAGTDLYGNTIYLGDIVLKAKSRDTAPNAFDYREIMVARIAMEVRAGALAACYSADALADTTEQLRQICTMTTSADGAVNATWTGTSCTTPDNTAPTTCGALGGSWTGTSCAILVQNYSVNAGQDYGAAGGVWYPAYCPTGFRPTGVFSLSGSGPSPPLYGLFYGNAAWSSWPPGYESTQYVYSAECIR